MNPKNLSCKSLTNPLAIPPFLTGTGVAYNEAERVTGVRGVGPDRARLKIPHQYPRKTDPRSPFLTGTGVAYNEAERVT